MILLVWDMKRQELRIWYQYLQTALKHKRKVDKEFYKDWHLTKVKTQKFDTWLESHKDFLNPPKTIVKEMKDKQDWSDNNIHLRVNKANNYEESIKEIRNILFGRLNRTRFALTIQRPIQQQKVDDYLKCWKGYNEKNKTYVEIGESLHNFYKAKKTSYDKSRKLKRRKFPSPKEYNDRLAYLQFVKRYVNKADRILQNVCSGEFTGLY